MLSSTRTISVSSNTNLQTKASPGFKPTQASKTERRVADERTRQRGRHDHRRRWAYARRLLRVLSSVQSCAPEQHSSSSGGAESLISHLVVIPAPRCISIAQGRGPKGITGTIGPGAHFARQG